MKIKMLIFDLDGTAVPNRPDGLPSKEVIHAVWKAQKKVRVSVATGRDLSFCKKILDIFPIIEPSILSGGTQLYNPLLKKIVWEQKLLSAQLKQIIDLCSSFPYYLGVADEGEPVLIRNYKNISDKAIVYILNVPEGKEVPILAVLKTVSGIAVQLVVAWQPHCYDIHITHKNATKKHALQELLTIQNIKPAQVMAVGDSGNDLPLFENAGFKVAMGNASPLLKQAADVVVASVKDNGLAEAIQKYILG